jgi:hypothetical protein
VLGISFFPSSDAAAESSQAYTVTTNSGFFQIFFGFAINISLLPQK